MMLAARIAWSTRFDGVRRAMTTTSRAGDFCDGAASHGSSTASSRIEIGPRNPIARNDRAEDCETVRTGLLRYGRKYAGSSSAPSRPTIGPFS